MYNVSFENTSTYQSSTGGRATHKKFFLIDIIHTSTYSKKKSLRISKILCNITNYRKYIFANISVVSKLKLLYSKSLHSGEMCPQKVCVVQNRTV